MQSVLAPWSVRFDVTIFKGSTDPEKAKTPVFESPIYKAIGALRPSDAKKKWGSMDAAARPILGDVQRLNELLSSAPRRRFHPQSLLRVNDSRAGEFCKHVNSARVQSISTVLIRVASPTSTPHTRSRRFSSFLAITRESSIRRRT